MGKKAKKGDGAVRPEDVQGGEAICLVEWRKEGGREGQRGTRTFMTPSTSLTLCLRSFL